MLQPHAAPFEVQSALHPRRHAVQQNSVQQQHLTENNGCGDGGHIDENMFTMIMTTVAKSQRRHDDDNNSNTEATYSVSKGVKAIR